MKPEASVLLRLAVPSDAKYLSVVHERAREIAQSNRFGAIESEQWALAVEECAANSIEHAYAGRSDGEVDITLALEGDYLCAEICDEGAAFEPRSMPPVADVRDLAGREPAAGSASLWSKGSPTPWCGNGRECGTSAAW